MAIYGVNQPSLENSEVFEWFKNNCVENNVMTEGNINDSEVFSQMSQLTGTNQAEKAKWLIQNSKHVQQSDIEVPIIQLKMIQDTLTIHSVKAYENGQIILLYNEMMNRSMSQSIPYLTFNSKTGYRTYIFGDRIITKDKNNNMKLTPDVLRDMFISANLARGIKTNYDKLNTNAAMVATMMRIYSGLFIRVLNREYSIMADRMIREQIEYCINRFFITKIITLVDTSDSIHLLAHKDFKELADEIDVQNIRVLYEHHDPQNLSGLIELIKTISTRCNALHLGILINKWVDMYYMPAMLALDNIEYLFLMILSMLSGNNIISRSASEVVKEDKHIKPLREQLLLLIT